MNERPPDRDEADDVDELYRRASALDSSRPSDTVRKAVLAQAERLAAERSQAARRPRNPTRWWWPAVFGSLAAAALAGLMVLPRILAPSETPVEVTVTAYARQATAAPEPSPSPQEIAVAPADELKAERAPPPPAPAAARGKMLADERARESTTARPAAPPPEVAARAYTPPARVASSQSAQPAAAPESAAASSPPAQLAAVPPAAASSQAAQSATTPQSAGASAQGAAAALIAPRVSAPVAGIAADSLSIEEARSARSRDSALQRPSGGAASSESALRRAAETGDVPELQKLLDAEAALDINSRDERGRTALMLAALHGRTDAVGVLLDRGADPNLADSQGLTPLQAATAGNEAAIIAALRRKGAR